MNNTLTNFILGLLSTGGAFILSLLLVVGGKMLYLSFKEKFIPQKSQPFAPPPKAPVIKRRKKKSAPIPKPVRSIEIDPEQVDRIYVKKIS